MSHTLRRFAVSGLIALLLCGCKSASREAPTDTSANDSYNIPSFPYPPPRSSARQPLPVLAMADGKPTKTLGDIDTILSEALDKTGYGTKGYYSFPGGFAMAVRMEQIYQDGRSMPQPYRSENMPPVPDTFSLEYFKGIFLPRTGYFRVIVFVVTNLSFAEDKAAANSDTAMNWPAGGANVLPSSIATIPVSADTRATALIYEFKNTTAGNSSELVLLTPETLASKERLLDGKVHLRQAGLWSALHLH